MQGSFVSCYKWNILDLPHKSKCSSIMYGNRNFLENDSNKTLNTLINVCLASVWMTEIEMYICFIISVYQNGLHKDQFKVSE